MILSCCHSQGWYLARAAWCCVVLLHSGHHSGNILDMAGSVVVIGSSSSLPDSWTLTWCYVSQPASAIYFCVSSPLCVPLRTVKWCGLVFFSKKCRFCMSDSMHSPPSQWRHSCGFAQFRGEWFSIQGIRQLWLWFYFSWEMLMVDSTCEVNLKIAKVVFQCGNFIIMGTYIAVSKNNSILVWNALGFFRI